MKRVILMGALLAGWACGVHAETIVPPDIQPLGVRLGMSVPEIQQLCPRALPDYDADKHAPGGIRILWAVRPLPGMDWARFYFIKSPRPEEGGKVICYRIVVPLPDKNFALEVDRISKALGPGATRRATTDKQLAVWELSEGVVVIVHFWGTTAAGAPLVCEWAEVPPPEIVPVK